MTKTKLRKRFSNGRIPFCYGNREKMIMNTVERWQLIFGRALSSKYSIGKRFLPQIDI